MGTRSTTMIIEKDGEKETPLCKLYIQYDGYESGVGLSIAKFSKDMKILNGFNSQKAGEAANGAGCYAAQLISHLKENRIGNVYVTNLEDSQEYNYEIIVEAGEPITMRVDNDDNFNGTAAEFVEKYSN